MTNCIAEFLNSYLGVQEKLVDANVMEFIFAYGKPHKPTLLDTIT